MNMDRLFWNGGNSMTNRVPSSALTLMPAVYLKIFPAVNRELDFWTKRAKQIPDDELRAQALASIAAKRFHCQGGAVYALLAGKRRSEEHTSELQSRGHLVCRLLLEK